MVYLDLTAEQFAQARLRRQTEEARKARPSQIAIEEQGLGLDYADRYRASIAKVTAADVQRVAQKFFVPDTFNQVVVGAAK